MIKIRRDTFETNSSSTHTITIITAEEYEKWHEGKLLLQKYSDRLVPVRELTDADKRDAKEEYEVNRKIYWQKWEDMDEYSRNQVYAEYSAKLMGNDPNLLTEKQWDEWCADRGMETSCVSYTTPSGDKIVAFGYGGYDG